MKGKHSIVVRNRRVQFALELERNITVIRGDSATGKRSWGHRAELLFNVISHAGL